MGFIWNVGYILWLYGFAISFCKRLFATAQSILYFITNENDNSPKVLLFLQVFILFPENCLFVFAISSKVLYSKALFQQPKAHHMCFDRFLLAFESRDLSQVDKSIIRVSSFPSLVIRGRTFFSVSQQLILKFSAKRILSILSDLSLTRKTEISVYFLFWMMKLTKTPNCQVLNSCF